MSSAYAPTSKEAPPEPVGPLSAWEQACKEFNCEHDIPACRHILRYSIASNGVKSYRVQCNRCGKNIQTLKKVDVAARRMLDIATEFDRELEQAWNNARSERYQTLHQQERDQKDQDWWDRYNAYLQSPEWARRRAAVLRRDGGICQGCGNRPATQAHHHHYRRVFDEMLFDLIAVCTECHEKIHNPGVDN